MSFPEALDLFAYWAEVPPVHISVAMYLGIGRFSKSGKGSGPTAPDKGSIGDLAAFVPTNTGAKPAFGPEALPPELREKLLNAANG